MNWQNPKVYAVRHKDDNVRAASRSGGIFTAVSDAILEQGGVVYGSALTDDFRAIHVRADNQADRDRMRGSKYIQSRIGEVYRNVQEDLTDGRAVLFTGTSCQVSGLQRYLGKEYHSLLCIDIVCHGVPSLAVWQEYLQWQEHRNHGKVVHVDFRNKRDHGWRAHTETLWFDQGRRTDSEVFKNLFYGHRILRPSCYECPYKSITHPGDITIADYWGIEKAAPEFDDNKGVSLVLINNDRAEQAFENVKDTLHWKATRIEDSMQPPLEAPFPRPEDRDQFWEDFRTKRFSYVARKYGGAGTANKVRTGLRMLRRRLKGMIKRLAADRKRDTD